MNKSSLIVNQQYEGETIENKINRIVNNKEAITDGAPLIYTDREDGVLPEYDIRTDRFEIAVDAMDKVEATKIAERDKRIADKKEAKIVTLEAKNEAGKTGESSAEPKP